MDWLPGELRARLIDPITIEKLQEKSPALRWPVFNETKESELISDQAQVHTYSQKNQHIVANDELFLQHNLESSQQLKTQSLVIIAENSEDEESEVTQ